MKSIKLLIFILLSLFCINTNAQNNISGTIIDEFSKEKLAFVNIVINEDGTLGTTSDIDGNFSITTTKEINSLTFSFIGYEIKTIDITDSDKILVKLKPLRYELPNIIIDGNNNPANRIIDSVYKYRDVNNPNRLDSYYYKIYDNMIFTIDTVATNNEYIRNEIRDKDLLAMETVSEQYYQKPNKSRKNILANKFSGSEDPMFIYILENIQSIGFYEDMININNDKFINPISKGCKNKYIFVLESAFKNENNDSIFTISFQPYKNTNFNALKGSITVNSDNWAIQNIKAKPNKQNGFLNIEIQQLYEKVDGIQWFPKQLNTIISTYSKPEITNTNFNDSSAYVAISINGSSNLPLLGIGKSYITDIEINKETNKNTFNGIDFLINDNAGNADDIIRYYRYDTLSSERLEATYKFIDSLFKEENISLDMLGNFFNTLMSGQIPIYIFDLNLSDLLGYNINNGYMLGLGLTTNKRLSKVFSIGGYGNYWFKAKKFNYGGEMVLNIMRSKDMKLKFGANHKFSRIGNYGFKENEILLDPYNYKYFYTKSTSLNNSVYVNYSTYLNKHIKAFVNFDISDKTLFDKNRIIDNNQQTYRLSTLDFKLRIAWGEKFIKSKEGLKIEGDANPIIWLSYQKNLKDVLGSPYNFDKFEFLFRGKNDTRYFGETSLTAQMGYINGLVPVTELFNIYGTGENTFDVYCIESFSTMRPDEFFCDRFGALYLSHNFKSLLVNFKRFHPEIVVVTNIAWGDLRKGNNYYNFKDLSKGYYESGLIIDNIINIALCKLGLGAFYRYGPYSYDNTWDNFVFKINIGINL